MVPSGSVPRLSGIGWAVMAGLRYRSGGRRPHLLLQVVLARYDPELLEGAQAIPQPPLLDDLASGDAIDAEGGPLHRLAARREFEEWAAGVRTARGGADDHRIALGGHRFDRRRHV